MSLVGNLEELGLGEILQIVSLSSNSGILSLHSKGREGSIFFRKGLVVRATSSIIQQSLGEVLNQNGVIDLAILRKALALQQEEGFHERLSTVLVKNFGISNETVEEVVRGQIEHIVYSFFSWFEGTFEFVATENIDTVEATRQDPLQFMLDHGLNPQFLAMEGARLHEEGIQAAEEEFHRANQDTTGRSDPAAKPAVPLRRSSAPGAKPDSKRPLVIVDDDGPTLKAMAEGMRQQGYDVHAMTRSEDTLIKVDALCRGNEHPTILIDLIMPKMDGSGVLGGLELLELLHNNFTDIHIILMSDYRHVEAETKVRDLGYNFIMKPRRTDLNNTEEFQGFLGVLCGELCQVESGEEVPEEPASFNLGDEMRIEMGDGDDDPVSPGHESGSSMSLLRGMLEELNNPDLQGGVLLLVLRFASEFLNRAIVFSVHDKIVSGAGQFGISGGKSSGDERVRAIHFPLEADSMFKEPSRTLQAVTFTPQPTAQDAHIFEQLGDGIPEQAFIGPLVSQNRVIGFLYGDNLPEDQPVGDTESLSIFLSQAGVALEKCNLERQLHERIKQ